MQTFNLNIFTFFLFFGITVFLFYCIFAFLKNKIKYIFLSLSFLLVFLSIFDIKYFSKEEKKEKWLDIVFVLDVSKSMNAVDIEGKNWFYTRLDFSKKIISDFVLKNNQNRFSLITFSWEAKSVLPFTNDTDLFLTFLEKVDFRDFQKQGSDFWSAIKLANSRALYGKQKNKIVIFISDGWEDEDFISGDFFDLKDKNNNYFILWVWSEKWWKIFLWQDVFGWKSYQKYEWKDVLVKLNEKNLKKISKNLNWEYLKIDEISDLKKFYSKFENFEKNIYEKNFIDFQKSFARNLTFFSFIFFLLFLAFYTFDFKKYEK